jgi:hypothetical protein
VEFEYFSFVLWEGGAFIELGGLEKNDALLIFLTMSCFDHLGRYLLLCMDTRLALHLSEGHARMSRIVLGQSSLRTKRSHCPTGIEELGGTLTVFIGF